MVTNTCCFGLLRLRCNEMNKTHRINRIQVFLGSLVYSEKRGATNDLFYNFFKFRQNSFKLDAIHSNHVI